MAGSFHSQGAQETGCATKLVVYLPAERSKTLVVMDSVGDTVTAIGSKRSKRSAGRRLR